MNKERDKEQDAFVRFAGNDFVQFVYCMSKLHVKKIQGVIENKI